MTKMFSCDCTDIFIVTAIAIPLLYEFSNKFRLYFKFLIFYSMVFSVATLFIPIFLFRPRNVRNANFIMYCLRVLNPLLGLNFEIRGLEHLQADRAAVVVANHQSSVDLLGLVILWPEAQKMFAVAKQELFYAMPFGLSCYLCGAHFIDRRNPEKAKQSLNDVIDSVKEKKNKMLVFPEGTRSMTGQMKPFKKGAFHIAISGEIPVIPIVFSSYQGFLSHPLNVFNPGHIIITCLPPITTEGMTKEDLPDLMENVRQQMMEAFVSSSAEVKHPYPSLPFREPLKKVN